MNTLTLETSKRLAPYLTDVDTEYVIDFEWVVWELKYAISEDDMFWYNWYDKTLTLEEAIEFLPVRIKNDIIHINKIENSYSIEYWNLWFKLKWSYHNWKTLLEAIEKMINYLLDNKLLND